MNWLDAVILVFLLLGMRRGFQRGLGQEGFQIAGALAGVLAAYAWGERAAGLLLHRLWLPAWLAKPVALVGLALALAFLGHLLGAGWSRWMATSSLRTWDRWGGALLGLVQASVLAAVALFIWIEWPGRPFPPAAEGSWLARSLLRALPVIYGQLEWVLAPLR